MTPDREKDEAAVKKWVDKYLDLAENGDERWFQLWADDAVMLPPNMRPVKGIDAINEFMGPGFGKFDLVHDKLYLEIKTDTSIAYASWSSNDKTTLKEGGITIEKENKCIWILRREPDDTWKATHCIWSPNQPPDDNPSYVYDFDP